MTPVHMPRHAARHALGSVAAPPGPVPSRSQGSMDPAVARGAGRPYGGSVPSRVPLHPKPASWWHSVHVLDMDPRVTKPHDGGGRTFGAEGLALLQCLSS